MAPSPLHPRLYSWFSSHIEQQAGAPPHWVHCVLLGSLLITVAVQPGRCRRFIGTLLARSKHAPRTLRMEDEGEEVKVLSAIVRPRIRSCWKQFRDRSRGNKFVKTVFKILRFVDFGILTFRFLRI